MSKKQIVRAAGVVMAAFLVSRLLGLAREMIIGQQFGTSRDLDAYLAAFRLPDLIFQLIAGGALGSAFIPIFAGFLTRNEKERAWQLGSAIISLVFLSLGCLAVLLALLAPWLVARVVAPGFDADRQALTTELMRLMLVSSVLFGVSGVVMGILNSFQHFLLPALAPAIYNLSIIGGAIFLAPTMGIHGLAVGVIVGAMLHLAIQVPGLMKRKMIYRPHLGLSDPAVRVVGRLMLPRALGLAVVQLNFLVNTILASGLVEGSLASLNYAWLLMLLPQGIFAQAVATAAFPTFAALAAGERQAEMRDALSSTLRAVLYLAIPASVGLFTLRYPLVRLLFQRGAFDAGSTEAVTYALQFYALGLFAHAVLEIVTRAFYAQHDTLTPVVVGVMAMGLNIVLSLLLIGPLAHGGLALANSVATIIEVSILVAVMRPRLAGIDEGRLLSSLLRTLGAATLMGLGVSLFVRLTDGTSAVLGSVGSIALGGAIYLAASWVLGAEEVRAAWWMGRER